ncbi:MAG: SpoIIE family protein phosphatase [Thiohalocapsa sp.]|nr:SpoIIE family protein phosphatase [Thiohalocapsa sp.]
MMITQAQVGSSVPAAGTASTQQDHAPGARKVLVIDDAPDVRAYVRALLRKWGFEAVLASNGAEGLERLREGDIRLVICDWMMDGMSGPEVCAAIRRTDFAHYVYVMLLTGRTEDTDLVYGLDAGADDFVGKPFDVQVLRARLQVGVRILGLEERLAEQNRRLKQSHDALDGAYRQIQNDLAAAARIQRESLPVSDENIAPLRAGWLFLPAAKISGDSFQFFPISADEIGFYHLDVAGHGIPAALLSTSLSRSLVPHTGIVQHTKGGGEYLNPAGFLHTLNEELCSPDGEVSSYATVVYGVLNPLTGEGRLALAGHPQPLLLRTDGSFEFLPKGGLPVGMFDTADYTAQRFRLAPGERIITYSDGITDCFDAQGRAFDIEHLCELLRENRALSSKALAALLRDAVLAWRGDAELEDDVSLLIIERPAA